MGIPAAGGGVGKRPAGPDRQPCGPRPIPARQPGRRRSGGGPQRRPVRLPGEPRNAPRRRQGLDTSCRERFLCRRSCFA